ncbi:sporulation protein [Planomicrobium sp. CPCC 101110]|uniref:sporulation protein n=1 Tax=Planomicrobium sp. CPCC 101110 TaxID=2599619 RepID=UPI0011B38953|nr:sporulation protein [Planomicrobium sp. CPCC 101110]TWT25891.1 sporulation protein [Planomicrobium sp. CPCC 101110]
MSFFDKVKASAGIGNAKVDTRINTPKVKQGGQVAGEIVIKGGSVEQPINSISISIETSVLVEQDDRKYRQDFQIQHVKVSDALTIAAKDEKVLPFSFALSYEIPMTIGKNDVWLDTVLDVPFALDPKDKDYIEVAGTEAAEKVLAAIRELGFTLKSAANLKSRQTKSGFVQEFEFYPGPDFKKHFTELELIFLSDTTGTTVYIEMDHKAKGLGGLLAQALDMDESRLSVRFEKRDSASVSEVARKLRDTLLKNVR